jgi:hypothetical protein
MNADPRYQIVDNALPEVLPAITQVEAKRAIDRICRVFGAPELGSTDMHYPARWNEPARRCWASTRPTSGSDHFKGWGRLIHDASHFIYEKRCPRLRAHGSGHERLEAEIATYVVAQGWLTPERSLAPKAKPKVKASANEKQAALEARLKRWRTKFKRAHTEIKKLERQLRRMQKAVVSRPDQG